MDCITKQCYLKVHSQLDYGPRFGSVWKTKFGKRMLHDEIQYKQEMFSGR